MTKFILVTGGVVSSVGKGIVVAAMGRMLKERGVSVSVQKLDPYINVDPGTMSPYQHGEVFVTDDGAETDLDLGHYERFIDINLRRVCNVTTGQIYSEVIGAERRGNDEACERAIAKQFKPMPPPGGGFARGRRGIYNFKHGSACIERAA